jgi:murein DD-endopeptidase MepM/ murein hydrolase activator NlpD
MESPRLIRIIREKLEDESHWLTRRKLVIIGLTLVVTGVLVSVYDTTPPAHERLVHTEAIRMMLPEDDLAGGAAAGVDSWHSVTVRPGQTLDAIFREQGFSIPLLHRILALGGETRGLTRIRPGEVFDFRKDEDGELSEMRYAIDESRYLLVRQLGGELALEFEQRDVVTRVAEAQGVIDSSLFVAGKQAGLSDAMVMKLANIFVWDIDFVLEIREGDRFMLVYEKVYRDGEFLREGEILAATFINQGARFQAVRFEDGELSGYFAPDGRNMKKAFLRAPLNFSYISSNFNPRRLHPVLKRIRPHNGTDYYAPRGTPVYAAGDGTVTRAAYSAANGHHVFIKHAGGIETRYLHFTQRMVKQGQKIRQGQTIGTVGSTGLATGPHLHYEFVVNGVHRDPRKVPLPKVEPLQGETLLVFQQASAPLLTQLSRLESASLYASRE